MTENEAIECIKKIYIDTNQSDKCISLKMAISALIEIQKYRALGTVEEIEAAMKYLRLSKKHGTIGQVIDSCAEYEALGTVEQIEEQMLLTAADETILREYKELGVVEELQEAREKLKEIEEIVNLQLIAGKNDYKEIYDSFHKIVKAVQR